VRLDEVGRAHHAAAASELQAAHAREEAGAAKERVREHVRVPARVDADVLENIGEAGAEDGAAVEQRVEPALIAVVTTP
jgi:hypothetical protein